MRLLSPNIIHQEGAGSPETQPEEAFCFYSLPGTSSISFIKGTEVFSGNAPAPGSTFIYAPFSGSGMYNIIPANNTDEDDADPDKQYNSLCFRYRGIPERSTPREHYKSIVYQALLAFAHTPLQKVVLSRNAFEQLPHDLDVMQFLQDLAKAYPQAFVYLLSSPSWGVWAGASPEILLKASEGNVETMALAGTRAGNGTDFAEKELIEQGLVSHFVGEQMRAYCKEVTESLPDHRQAGNINHIVTHFKGKLNGYGWPELLKALHPTPAVGGMPVAAAQDFITRSEDYGRELYSGYIGPIQQAEAGIFVNLRCMQIGKNGLAYYAGAGIVPGSVAEKEWEETELKMDTLRKVMHS